MSEQHGLVSPEGVDEGSAASTVEERRPTTSQQDLVGEAPHGAPEGESDAAGPVDMESESSRQERALRGPGQQLQGGEG